MDVNLTEINKPEVVKRTERNLDKATREHKKNNSAEEDFPTTHTPLTEWSR